MLPAVALNCEIRGLQELLRVLVATFDSGRCSEDDGLARIPRQPTIHD
jgi:hypothetical protein